MEEQSIKSHRPREHASAPGLIKTSLIVASSTCLLFVMVEGLSSTVISVYQLLQSPSLVEDTQYHSSLGWTAVANAYTPDAYGPGKHVRINSHGFRGNSETAAEPSPDKVRVICSGNSFTYGQGVGNEDTWCHLLSDRNNMLETVNLGQPGYGIDQMYLRYRSEGLNLDPAIHVFAFVSGDLDRITTPSRYGYGKPILVFDETEDELRPANVPVPRWRSSINRALLRANFRSIEFFHRLHNRLEWDNRGKNWNIEAFGSLARAILQEVQRSDEAAGIVPIFVYLPTKNDLGTDKPWRLWTIATMNELGAQFVDLTPFLRQIPAGRAATFFIPPSQPANGHYTELGNKWAAETVYTALMDRREVARALTASADR